MEVFLKIIAVMAIGYVIGMIHPSYIVSKIKQINIKQKGTKNYGASNTFLVVGKMWGVLVALLDIGKGALATLIPMWIFPGISYLQYLGGAMAVVGHIYPFYLKFDGGKGFAAYVGMVFAINWQFGLIMLPIVVVLTFIINYMITSTMTVIFTFPIFVAAYCRDWIGFVIVILTSALIFYKHIPNFKKIKTGEEAKLSALFNKKKDPPQENPPQDNQDSE